MKTKLLLLPFLMSCALGMQRTQAQTTLVPGDIAILWYQADTPDSFAFTTFVDLEGGTQILFTDCGAVPAGTFDPAGCGEGANVYTVPVSGIEAGEIISYNFAVPTSEFSNYSGDSVITSATGMSLSTGGDSITVLQGTGESPSLIFILSGSSTTFSGDDSNSTTETNLFTGLTDVGLPRTAVAVGSGPLPSQEFDNAVYSGSYTFTTIQDAKIALTTPANYVGANDLLDSPYNALVAAIPDKLNILALSTNEFDLGTVISVYPNPSKGQIIIKNSGVALETLTINDVNGRRISYYDLNGASGDQSLDLRNMLSSGMYLMEIVSKKGSTIKKLLIQ
ncbi:MAG: T9SS type A sorting domain-containing protein [Algicola sp.]|nr:T9SS type A sorting domain-containing protein [Algicola sp.]